MRLGRDHWSHSLECFFLTNSFMASVYSCRVLGDTSKPQAKQGVTCFPSGCMVPLAASGLTYLPSDSRELNMPALKCTF